MCHMDVLGLVRMGYTDVTEVVKIKIPKVFPQIRTVFQEHTRTEANQQIAPLGSKLYTIYIM